MSTEIETRGSRPSMERAIAAFQEGLPVLVHDFDDREGETDIVYPAGAVDPADVSRLRNDAGGLICVALPHEVTTELALPFAKDAVDHPSTSSHELSYDERSSFSITVNHRDTDTGITDDDRSLTIRELARTSSDADLDTFVSTFRSPGHVPILRAAPGLLDGRQGHTELGLALAEEAGVAPAVVVCEMLNDHSGGSLSKQDAERYATRRDIPYISGRQILQTLG